MRVISAGASWIALALVLLVTGAAYWVGLDGGFMFDDKPNIIGNPLLHVFDGSFSSLLMASNSGTAGPFGRPLSMASFALNFHFFGNDPFSFKLVNLLIHLANGLLIFVLVRQLWPGLVKAESNEKSWIPALWVTAVWLLHPINVTPVLFVVQRMTSLSAFFVLMTLCLYLGGRHLGGAAGKRWILIGLAICWPAALVSKESALLLPLFIFICEWLVLGSFQKISPKMRRLGLASALVLLAGLLVWKWNWITGGYGARDFSLMQRLMTEARVLWFYLCQLLFPWPDLFSLHHDDIALSRSLVSPPQTLLAILGWIAVVLLILFKSRQWPVLVFAFSWFLAAHALESTIFSLEIAYEHRNYLASIGILIWLAKIIYVSRESPAGKKMPIAVLAAGFVVLCTSVTALRAAQWADELHRTQVEVIAHPRSSRAQYEAAMTIMDRVAQSGTPNSLAYQTARSHFEHAAALAPLAKDGVLGMLYIDCLTNSKKDPGLQAELQKRFAKARLLIGDRRTINSMSELLVENRLCLDDNETMALLESALSNPTADSTIRGMLYAVAMDYALVRIKSMPLALHYARKAVDSDPVNVAFRINIIHLLLASGDMVASQKEYAILSRMRISPSDEKAVEVIKQKFEDIKNAKNH